MNGIEALECCRAALMAIRERSQELDMLMRGMDGLPDGADGFEALISAANDALAAARLAYPEAMGRAVAVISGLPECERRVLTMHYVMGQSLKSVAGELHYHVRTVQKLKKSGLKRLK